MNWNEISERKNDLLLRLDGQYEKKGIKTDVYIFGEEHNNSKHQEEQEEKIKKINPDYILMEALNDESPETGEKVKNRGKKVQRLFENVCEIVGNYGMKPDVGETIFDSDEESLDELVDSVEKLYEKYEERNKKLKENPEAHKINQSYTNFLSDLGSALDEIKEIYKKNVANKHGDRIGYIASEIGAKLAGCDSSDEKKEKLISLIKEAYQSQVEEINSETEEEMAKKIKEYILNHEGDEWEEINSGREEEMAKKIEEYASEAKKNGGGKVVAIMGREHANRLGPRLEERDINYRILKQWGRSPDGGPKYTISLLGDH